MNQKARWIKHISIIVLYIMAQLIVLPVALVYMIMNQGQVDEEAVTRISLIANIIGFIIALIVIGILFIKIKAPFDFELKYRQPWLVSLGWLVFGVVFAYITQIITSIINTQVLKNPMQSENTMEIMEIAFQYPFFILIVAILGPILEELVFRKVLFGEIFNALKINKYVAFTIAFLISGFIFAIAHMDFTHIIIYLGMSFVFSLIYVMTGRIIVPIIAHALMNTIVVILQFTFKDTIKDLEQFQELSNLIFYFLI